MSNTSTRNFAALTLILTGLAGSAQASEVLDIKGLSIGMSEQDAERRVLLGQAAYNGRGINGLFCRPVLSSDFTVAGARPTMANLCFRDKALATMYFDFQIHTYKEIREAVLGKYPGTKCKQYVPQGEDCAYDTRAGELRFYTGTNIVVMSVRSRSEIERNKREFEEFVRRRKGDI